MGYPQQKNRAPHGWERAPQAFKRPQVPPYRPGPYVPPRPPANDNMPRVPKSAWAMAFRVARRRALPPPIQIGLTIWDLVEWWLAAQPQYGRSNWGPWVRQFTCRNDSSGFAPQHAFSCPAVKQAISLPVPRLPTTVGFNSYYGEWLMVDGPPNIRGRMTAQWRKTGTTEDSGMIYMKPAYAQPARQRLELDRFGEIDRIARLDPAYRRIYELDPVAPPYRHIPRFRRLAADLYPGFFQSGNSAPLRVPRVGPDQGESPSRDQLPEVSVSQHVGRAPQQAPPHRRRPPGKFEKERKGTGGQLLKAVFNAGTEAIDAIDAVWYALPWKIRHQIALKYMTHWERRTDKLGREYWALHSQIPVAARAKGLYDHAASIDLSKALRNIVVQQLQDRLAAAPGQAQKKLFDKFVRSGAQSLSPSEKKMFDRFLQQYGDQIGVSDTPYWQLMQGI